MFASLFEAHSTFCSLYCKFPFIDFCDTRDLPGIGDLNTKFPVGRFWRFQVLGDPTVSYFGSRDTDSYLREAVKVEKIKKINGFRTLTPPLLLPP